MTENNQYLGNPNLKKANISQEWSKDQLSEYAKCMEDPQYFIENYVRIVSLDEGLIPFKMYPFQKEMVGTLAVGVNMPARTVVFSQLDKPNDGDLPGHRPRRPDASWQMAGRSGRRAMARWSTETSPKT